MDVTRQNYYTLLPELKKAISEADFIAVDGEFTGLNSGGREFACSPFDTPKQYYEKVHKSAIDFLLVQLGVSIFQYDPKSHRYSHADYNFYLFPTQLKGSSNSVFRCQSSSIHFLSSHGFDFNKVFREGIPYMNKVEEDRMRGVITERHEKMSSSNARDFNDITIPDDQKDSFEDIFARIKTFLEGKSETEDDMLVLDRCNAWTRRILYQEVPKKFGKEPYLETREIDGVTTMVIMKGGEELRKKKEEEKKEKDWKDFEDAVGFSRFIKHISESGKLVVGHNCLLDFCHILNHFRYPLPSDYGDFKEMIHHVFPRLIDTKYMATAHVFKDVIKNSTLGALLETASEPPFQMPDVEGVKDQSYDVSAKKEHEAGYDAYITGLCFLSMYQAIAKDAGKKMTSIDAMGTLLEQFMNRLFLMKVQDVPCMTLGGPEPKPPRNHVFHLSFPREWRHFEISELFKPFGSVFVSFLDDQSAFVALHRRDQAKLVLKTMTESSVYKLTTYAAFQNQNEKRKSPPPQSRFVSPSSPCTESVRKRKSMENLESPSSLVNYKRRCSTEQPSTYSKRSIDPIPEEQENNSGDNQGGKTNKGSDTTETSKAFPESEDWE